MALTDLILGLLGGGVCVQLLQTLLHRRANARQLNANALGTEVEALEHTITVLRSTLDAVIERHERERRTLLERIEQLNGCVASLTERLCRSRGVPRQHHSPTLAPSRSSDNHPLKLRPPP